MLKKTILLILSLATGVGFFAQNGNVVGEVTDKTTGETLIGASVTYTSGKGTITDFEGQYSLNIPYGEYTLTYSFVGMKTTTKKVVISSRTQKINVKLESEMLEEVEITGDIAKERETPVAFTNISPKKLEEELASQDLPMVLNSTPGVYATQQGGGDGDARITIRGFSQRNLAVMIDGVPVNDMENGWVYWSNWFGLDMVTSNIQVQRGLGVSKLAVPSVGGTMNIFTKGINQKQEFKAKFEVGTNLFQRQSISYNSGKLKNGWGFSAAFSRKKGMGWADQTYTDGMFFFGKIEKKFKNHLVSLSAYGAPQSHGQRSYMRGISTFDSEYARKLGVSEEAIQHNNNIGGGDDFGYKYNEYFGTYINKEGKSILLREKENIYFKPQITLKDFWQVSDKFYMSNIVYLSIGKGGGTGISSKPGNLNGHLDAQTIYQNNTMGDFGPPILSEYHPTELNASKFKYLGANNHFWLGLLSTGTYVKNENVSISGGFDLRTYQGEHYREVYDLIGGDYTLDNNSEGYNHNTKTPVRKIGDKVYYHDLGRVNWGGVFGQIEYKKDVWSAFVSASGSASAYNGVDYFRKKTLNVDGKTLEIGYYDTVNYNGVNYDRNSEGLKTYETGWKTIPGFTVKAGANYLINEFANIFVNVGYLNNAPKYRYVIDRANNFVHNYKNEKIQAFELGYSYTKKKVAIDVNTYVTNWQDRPERIGGLEDEDGEPLSANVLMNARHLGAEFEIAYNVTRKLTVEAVVSVGDWTWQSKKDSIFFEDITGKKVEDENGNVKYVSFDARGVHVGDAAQTQLGASIKYNLTKRIYLKARYTWFDRYYSQFEPTSLVGVNAQRESWEIPSYGIMDIHFGGSFLFNKKIPVSLRMSVLNALDNNYISDAQNNGEYPNPKYKDFDASSATVFFGQGRRFNVSLQLKF